MSTVKFTAMKAGSKVDYQLLDQYEHTYKEALPERLINYLASLDDTLSGYQVSRLEHSLQTATRAAKDGADEEMVVAALFHDIGDELATANHSEFAAAILKPYVSERVYWVVKHHGLFQTYYYVHHFGGERNQREQYKHSPYYQDTVDFCERWDQVSFDPNYDNYALGYFKPLIKSVFSKSRLSCY